MPILINAALYNDDFKLALYDKFSLWVNIYKYSNIYENVIMAPQNLNDLYDLIEYKSIQYQSYENFYNIIEDVYTFNKNWILEDNTRFNIINDINVFFENKKLLYSVVLSENNCEILTQNQAPILENILRKYNNCIEVVP